ncbi:MFS transporter [Alteromonas sp. D210916BOD_24]|uniref:MFS transporter n=1 Tax=Alteromonas sp. D210916BOD_24 TaxID=3157618 RepID=UPI00399CEA70
MSLNSKTVGKSSLLILALTYWLYFGQLGVLVPYLGIFLDGRGFSSAEIGELFAVITLARILGPGLWAGVADKTGNAIGVMRLGCFLTVLTFSSVFYFTSFWGLTLAFGLMMMFWTAVLPQLEVITMSTVAKTKATYGQIRLWGSVGFICLTVMVGKALDMFSTDTPVHASIVVLTLLFVSTLFIRAPNEASVEHSHTGSIWKYAKQRPFAVFIFASACLQISFGAYYGFFALYMRDLDYSGQQTGIFIALGVLAEVGIFLVARRLISQFGVWNLLFASLALTALRWYALAAFADVFTVIIVSQLIHALSFGLTHAVSVHFIHQFLPKAYHSRGQAVYISVAFGLGGAFGNYLAGQQWQQGTHAYETFVTATVFAAIAALSMFACSKQTMDNVPKAV